MNPMMAMLGQMMKGGGNPQAMIQQLMSNNAAMKNPMIKNALQMYQQGNIDGVKEMVSNLAKENGTTLDEAKSATMKMFGM